MIQADADALGRRDIYAGDTLVLEGFNASSCGRRSAFVGTLAAQSTDGIRYSLTAVDPDSNRTIEEAGICTNQATGRTAVTVGRPGTYQTQLVARHDAAQGAGDQWVVVASWNMTVLGNVPLALRNASKVDCGAPQLAAIAEAAGPAYGGIDRKDRGSVVLIPGFNFSGKCTVENAFHGLVRGGSGEFDLTFSISVTSGSNGTEDSFGDDALVNPKTGRMSLALAETGNYTVTLQAHSMLKMLSVAEFNFDIREKDTYGSTSCADGAPIEDEDGAGNPLPQNDMYSCRCAGGYSAASTTAGLPTCADAPADATNAATTALGTVVLLVAVALVASRVQVYRIKHKPVDVGKIQAELLVSLGLAQASDIGASEWGLNLVLDREIPPDARAQWGELKESFVACLRNAVPQIRASLRDPRADPGAGPASRMVLVVMRKVDGGHRYAESAVEDLARKARKGKLAAGGFRIVGCAQASPKRIPREVTRRALTRLRPLGEGVFGEVHQYQLDEPGSRGISVFVAAKSIKAAAAGTAAARADLLREAALGALLVHRNVVSTIGVCTIPRDVPALLLLAFCPEGRLEEHVNGATAESITVAERLTYCAQVLQGLQYISARRIVHRDVASRNVLLDSTWVCKVSDFGMAAALVEDGKEYIRSTEQLALRWCAIEVIVEGKYSVQSDVWAFGVLAYEVFACGTVPYSDRFDNLTEVSSFVKEGGKLLRPNKTACPTEVYEQLVLPCFASDPAARPSFGDLYDVVVLHGAEEDEEVMDARFEKRRMRRVLSHTTADRSLQGPSVHHVAEVFLPAVVTAINRIQLNTGHEQQAAFDTLDSPDHASIWHAVHSHAKPVGAATACPWDGKQGCAYVDLLVDDDDVGRADALLSYSWGYLVAEVSAALSAWCDRQKRDPKRTRIWICSLCLNQHRMADASLEQDLQKEFGDRVLAIGRILPMLEPWHEPGYVKRAWCLFELYIAIIRRDMVEIDIILSPAQALSFHDRINTDGTDAHAIDDALAHIHSENATASLPSDLEEIRALIQSYSGGFSTLNATVRQYLRRWFVLQGGMKVAANGRTTIARSGRQSMPWPGQDSVRCSGAMTANSLKGVALRDVLPIVPSLSDTVTDTEPSAGSAFGIRMLPVTPCVGARVHGPRSAAKWRHEVYNAEQHAAQIPAWPEAQLDEVQLAEVQV